MSQWSQSRNRRDWWGNFRSHFLRNTGIPIPWIHTFWLFSSWILCLWQCYWFWPMNELLLTHFRVLGKTEDQLCCPNWCCFCCIISFNPFWFSFPYKEDEAYWQYPSFWQSRMSSESSSSSTGFSANIKQEHLCGHPSSVLASVEGCDHNVSWL